MLEDVWDVVSRRDFQDFIFGELDVFPMPFRKPSDRSLVATWSHSKSRSLREVGIFHIGLGRVKGRHGVNGGDVEGPISDLLPDLFDPVLEDLTAVITVDYVLGTMWRIKTRHNSHIYQVLLQPVNLFNKMTMEDHL